MPLLKNIGRAQRQKPPAVANDNDDVVAPAPQRSDQIAANVAINSPLGEGIVMPLVDGILLFLIYGAPALATAYLLYADQHDRGKLYAKLRTSHAALSADHQSLLHALKLENLSSDQRRERLATIEEMTSPDTRAWHNYGSALPPDAVTHMLRNVQAGDLVRLLELQDAWSIPALDAILCKLETRLTDIADMERVWRNKKALEVQDVSPIVERSLWIFEPDFMVEPNRHRVNSSVRTVANELYGMEINDAIKERPDIVARSRSHLSLQPGHQWQEKNEGTLLLELKKPSLHIGTAEQTQASGYIRQLVRAGAIPENEPVDCYVIGGDVHDEDGGPRIEGWYHNVRITSLSYEHLIDRAKCLTLGLYDDIKSQVPFLANNGRQPTNDETQHGLAIAAE